jgi:hypothetical protein|tara:strand:+ start:749 stop:898 length:150 start_codon:yes stop_codon:yes gene_type:complete
MKKDKTTKVSQVGAPIKDIETTKPNESQTVQVRGTRRMLANKSKKATWY